MESVYASPELDALDLAVIERIDECRRDLVEKYGDVSRRRWVGGLRRMSLAKNVQASNSIEGYNASLDDVMMAMDGEQPLDANEETSHALAGYRDAMTYVLQIANDPEMEVDAGLLRSLHFMMLKYDLNKGPGRWRPGSVFVQESQSGKTVYEGPDHERIPALIDAMIKEMESDHSYPLVRAAMAHLNLVMIHPFRDGNGRMARCLQTLALVGDDISHPVFASIEEYLGRNTPSYYAVLAEVGQGAWNPHHDARPWVRFCLAAHLIQAETVRRRFQEAELLWAACDALARKHRLPERAVVALWEASRGFRIRRPGYIRSVEQTAAEEITEQTASRDLKLLVHATLLEPRGETRGRYYVASETLGSEWGRIRAARETHRFEDPYTTVQEASS